MTKSELLIIDLLSSIDKKLTRQIEILLSIKDNANKDNLQKQHKAKPINNNKKVVAEIVKYNE